MATDEVTEAVFGSVIEQLRQQSRVSQYRNDPVLWAKDVLGVHLWSKQEDVLRALVDGDHTAVRSCHGSGKSELASIIACWWISTRPVGEAIVVTTAPTYAQVHAILWEYIRKHHIAAEIRFKEGKSPMKLPGYITQGDQWKSESGVLLGFGRKPADGNDHGFQGIHRRYVLVLVDESCGIKENLFTAVEAITTTENSKILAIGNPDDPATYFNKMFTTDAAVWANVDIMAFDSPNFTKLHAGHYTKCNDDDEWMRDQCIKREWAKRWDRDKDTPNDLLPLLPNHEWVQQRRAAWGSDSPLWMSKVLGAFPLQSVNTLFSMETLNRGWETAIKPLRTDPVVLGVDVARFGPDYSVVYKNEGGNLRLVDFWGGKADEVDGTETAHRIDQLARKYGASEVRMDASGIGGPISDQLNIIAQGLYSIIPMRGDFSSPDNLRWVNARAFWFDKFREDMFNKLVDTDPTDKKLRDELENIQYHFKNRYHSLQIESKEEMEKRGLKSPDYADAAVYASADVSAITASPFGHLGFGDKISIDPAQLLGMQGTFVISPY